MQLLAIVPGSWAVLAAFGKSPQRAFLDVYIPILLRLTDYYRWAAPGLPDPGFSRAAIPSIALALVLKGNVRRWLSLDGLLVFGFAVYVGYLISFCAAVGWSIVTVYMGAQLVPHLVIIARWAERYLLSGRTSQGAATAPVYAPPLRFQRTIA